MLEGRDRRFMRRFLVITGSSSRLSAPLRRAVFSNRKRNFGAHNTRKLGVLVSQDAHWCCVCRVYRDLKTLPPGKDGMRALYECACSVQGRIAAKPTASACDYKVPNSQKTEEHGIEFVRECRDGSVRSLTKMRATCSIYSPK